MRVLLVEDDSATAQSIELMLQSEGFNVFATDLGGLALGAWLFLRRVRQKKAPETLTEADRRRAAGSTQVERRRTGQRPTQAGRPRTGNEGCTGPAHKITTGEIV